MKRITPEEFKNRFDNMTNNDYELLTDYVNKRTKIKIKHLECGHEFEMTPDNFSNGQRCPNCKNLRTSKTLKKNKQEINMAKLIKRCGTEYKLLSEYKGYREKITIKHISCGNIWDANYFNFVDKKCGCPKCSRKELYEKRRLTNNEFIERFNEKSNNEYELLSNYTNKLTKIKVKHLKCNYEWEVRPLDFLAGSGCPKCKESRGEREIRKCLDELNLKYQSQYKFDDCRNKNPLPFDFAVFNNNGTLKCLIEYHGIQHYKSTGYFKGVEKLKYTKHNDSIKEDYCNKNNIELIIIPYTDFNNIKNIMMRCKEDAS